MNRFPPHKYELIKDTMSDIYRLQTKDHVVLTLIKGDLANDTKRNFCVLISRIFCKNWITFAIKH